MLHGSERQCKLTVFYQKESLAVGKFNLIKMGVFMGKYIVLATLCLCFKSYAGRVERYDYQVQKFTPKTNQGDLVEFKVTTNKYKVFFTDDPDEDSPSHGSTMYAEYTTKEIDQLQDYAVVQYIKGCVFDSEKQADGSIKKTNHISREFFGDVVPFMHKKLVIDSVDVDPIYNSMENHRHGAYRWNEVQGSYAKATEHYFLNQEPDNPTLYVRDMPSSAFTSGYGGAKNVSLQFEACLIKTSDVPKVGTPELDLRGKALKCFKWDSSFIYNHSTEKYESKKTIDPYCL
jgi:hypothetical protein